MSIINLDECLKRVPNRFELVLLAAYRVRQLMNGSAPLGSNNGLEEGPATIALREVMNGEIGTELLTARKFYP